MEGSSPDDKFEEDDESEESEGPPSCANCKESSNDVGALNARGICNTCLDELPVCPSCRQKDVLQYGRCRSCRLSSVDKCKLCSRMVILNAYDICEQCMDPMSIVEASVRNVNISKSIGADVMTTCPNDLVSPGRPLQPVASEISTSGQSTKPVARRILVITGHGDWNKDYGYVNIPETCTVTILGPLGSVLGMDAAVCCERLLRSLEDLHVWAQYVRRNGLLQQVKMSNTPSNPLSEDFLYPMTLCGAGPYSEKQQRMMTPLTGAPSRFPNYLITLDENIGRFAPGEGAVTLARESIVSIRSTSEKKMLLSALLKAVAEKMNEPVDFIYSACAGSTSDTHKQRTQIESWPGYDIWTELSDLGYGEGCMDDYEQEGDIVADSADGLVLHYDDYGYFAVGKEINSLLDPRSQHTRAISPQELNTLNRRELASLAEEWGVIIVIHHVINGELESGMSVTCSRYGEDVEDDLNLHVLLVSGGPSKILVTLYAVTVVTV